MEELKSIDSNILSLLVLITFFPGGVSLRDLTVMSEINMINKNFRYRDSRGSERVPEGAPERVPEGLSYIINLDHCNTSKSLQNLEN